jgi:CIC family chloride channel protein
MAFGEIIHHAIGPAAGQPALYAVVAMGAVFAAAARAPLTAVASVVEMTGDFTLTLPVMLAVAVATATSRGLSYGTIYTTKLLRRGTDIDRTPTADPFEDLTAADAMRAFQPPLPSTAGKRAPGHDALPGPVTRQLSPQVLFATESLTQALRQLELYGRDGLPVISDDGQHLQGWITSNNVLQAVARHIHAAQPGGSQAQPAAEPAVPGLRDDLHDAPTPLDSYQLLEIAIPNSSPAAGQALGDIAWPPGCVPVTVLDDGTLRDPDPGIILASGDRVGLLAPAARNPEQSRPRTDSRSQPDERPAGQACQPADGDQRQRPAQ